VSTSKGTEYTRDGRLQTSADGTLTDSGGRPVLGPDGSPITLPTGYSEIQIKSDGTINAVIAGVAQNVGQIGTFRPQSPQAMHKGGDGLFVADPGTMQAIESDDTKSRLVQNALEGSTVQPVKEIANMTQLSRAYEQLQTLLSDDNDREQKMIQTLGSPV
jgi:flagellar basal body rod protein FlgG